MMKLRCLACKSEWKIYLTDGGYLECANCGDFIGHSDDFDLETVDNIERVYSTLYDCQGVPEGVRP